MSSTMPALSILTLGLAACGGPATSPDASADTGASPDAGPRPTGDGVGLFGPAPSFYELILADGRVDGFHFGASRTGFTWPFPVAGDFDGDGFDSVGFYDPRAHELHLHDDVADAETVLSIGGGVARPIVGDFDGDGVDGIGAYDTLTGAVVLRERAAPGAPERALSLPPGRFPLAADLDGDGSDELLSYADGSFTFTDSAGAPRRFDLGPTEGAYPFSGDLDGDGVDGLGVFDLAAERFLVVDDPLAGGAPRAIDVPPANWVRFPIAGRFRSTSPRPPDVGYAFDVEAAADHGVDPSGLEAADAALDAIPNTRALLVLTDGVLIHEAHFHGSRPEIAQNIKSVSKSILAAIVAVAADSGVDVAGPIYDRFPEVPRDADPRRGTIELTHMLTMTADLMWNEDAILDWAATDDWVASTLTAPLIADPGSTFLYSTALTHVVSAFLGRASGRPTDELGRELLFEPLGIRAERWDHDPTGVPVGGAEVTMRPRDLARFGQLLLQDGVVDGRRILPEGNAALTLTVHVPPSAIDSDLGYGLWWWHRSFGGTPAFFAWGYGGQLVILFDSVDTVVVLTSRSDVSGEVARSVAYQLFDVVADHVVSALPIP